MPLFDAISTTGTGMETYQTWLDTIANNIANINTVSPTSGPAFQATYVQAAANGAGSTGVGTGVHVEKLAQGSAEGRVTYDPSSPVADKDGYVRLPDIDMGEQMGNMIMAQRALQANAAVVDRAKQCYQAALDIGKNARS
ncbi:flagellar basal-body rod protein FlgC [Jatrophihabitans sp. GAS493]|uniref:flagellar basal body rod protein FlgC n=1 Tax=Jatrophihabitans sp. GAS493 TaxID=1907575 RepID=UPI000BB7C3FB|nr:flagellar basal body rod C-terminal domain-containing protein [Jatrophihabitans sp. GAS493]SOD71341.1 flagellar basal-body rod protein FlgC [Jatrophihabitans sp. GAS493]